MPNSLLAGNIQGISSIRASAARQGQPKTASNQYLTGQFPKHPNREFFAALQGIKSGDQGNFAPIRESRCRPLFRQQPCRQIVSSRQISNVAEKAEQGRRQMLGVAEADLQLEGGFVRVKGAPGMRKSLAELVDANDRRSGASRWRVGASRAARVHRAHRRRGTERVRIHLLQQRVSDEPLLAPEPSRSASVEETAGGSTGAAKKFAGYRWVVRTASRTAA